MGAGTPASGQTLGLKQAALVVGVSVSTLRRWADQQCIPSFRTVGGHRRFYWADVDRFRAGQLSGAGDAAAEQLGQRAARQIRNQLAVSPVPDAAWLDGLNGHARERFGLLGRQLLMLVEESTRERHPRTEWLDQARVFGLLYGRELIQSGLNLRQGLEAFTFFRRAVEEAAHRSTGTRDGQLRERLDQLHDRLLLGVAEAYEDKLAPGGGASASLTISGNLTSGENAAP